MNGGLLEIGGLRGDSGFRKVHKLVEMISNQIVEHQLTPLIRVDKITLINGFFRVSIRIKATQNLICSKSQVPLLLGSKLLFKPTLKAQEFKQWLSTDSSLKLHPNIWNDFQTDKEMHSKRFNQTDRELILQKSEDGSHTLFIPELNETYHSTRGSRTEAEYVFIYQGLQYFKNLSQSANISILEVGFGTGLNAWLSLKTAKEDELNLEYHTLEPYPIPEITLEYLEFGFENAKEKMDWKSLHHSQWQENQPLHPQFHFTKFKEKIEGYQALSDGFKYDLIYFDAFAPSKQPELWNIEVFQSCFKLLNKPGVLVSYCASSIFKKNLLKAGFIIETLKGPPGKREMVRAIKV
jgi:tRNA U34 5-methylaminomethyl-2-thiouridine-forming methyltransferase MnmC